MESCLIYSMSKCISTYSELLLNIGILPIAVSLLGRLIIFSKALGHIDDTVSDLFDRLEKRGTPVPTILAETFISLSACWRADEGRFIGCAQLLLA
ncbi:hypothetical protein Golax_023152 [Gossypium laxum]|uniref:Uncharacterized protein n=1 Tax=Gossypium laxum TaxID=34288 RepID=A0A7J9B121_9ROSI|nr:hypothetical protein [Gossypium laxum]